ncbi:unnamed protein product [Lepeophtheirus salmonis]|uniref:(salmon louse) hypothetical protein n=1 Tax=Lepeophtheirus salmonis TaxID=72036 RepID=A0A7R8H1W1_LEPSM|nr:unnamed protein product [Lepeophtheirus salmonis]CAF2802183.1 unnamed protein product [Lepeophtheirus salmonis]
MIRARYKDVSINAKLFRQSHITKGSELTSQDLENWLGNAFNDNLLLFLHKIRAVHEFLPELIQYLDKKMIHNLCDDVWSNEESDEELWAASLKTGITSINLDIFLKACSFKSLELALVAAAIRSQCTSSSQEEFPEPGTLAEAALISALSHRNQWNNDDLGMQTLIFDRIIMALKSSSFLFHNYDSLGVFLVHSNSLEFADKTLHMIEGMSSFSNVRGVQEKTLKTYEHAWNVLSKKDPEYSRRLNESRTYLTFKKSWKSKIKYGLLYVIHSRIRSIEDDCSESIKELSIGLIESLASNFLASLGSNLYSVLLKSMKAETWINEFLPLLINIFPNPDSVSIEYVKNLWIPSIVKILPLECANFLYSRLSQGESSPASISVQLCILKTQRMNGFLSDLNENIFDRLNEVKDHFDSHVRISCFSVICQKLNKGSPPSKKEFELFLSIIRDNLNIDSSSFRQKLVSHFTVMLLRVRDFCISSLKKNSLEEIIKYFMEGINNLEKYLVKHVYPSGNYQITITSLCLLEVLSQVFYESKGDIIKTSGVKSSEPLLIYVQKEYGFLNFHYQEKNRQILLRSLLHYMEDVRKIAKKILFRFPEPSNTERGLILKNAERLSNSPKISECESASDYYEILNAWRGDTANNKFFDAFLIKYNSLMDKFSCNGDYNVLQVVKEESSMHGILLALRKYSFIYEQEKITNLCLVRLVEALERSVQTMLRIMNPDNEEENPSFEKMGVSIQSYLEDEDEIPIEISGDHQLLLSCAWLNIKECALLSGFIVKSCHLVTHPEESEIFTLSQDLVDRCCKIVMTILRCCRHKGIMEGTNLAVEDIATRLLSEKSPWKEIPMNILEKVLKEIVFQSSSTTRRSAGIPMLLQGLVSSEAKLRPSHALHILKSLVNNSSISSGISPFLEKLFICCVNNFSSDSWGIRNASLQLFGALQPRLIGQKKLRDDDSEHNMPTQLSREALFDNQVLMPLLTLLSKLNNGEKDPYVLSKPYKKGLYSTFVFSCYQYKKTCYTLYEKISTDLENDFLELYILALQSNSANFLHSMSYLLEYLMELHPSSLIGKVFIQTFHLYPCFEIRSLLSKYIVKDFDIPWEEVSRIFIIYNSFTHYLIELSDINCLKKYGFLELDFSSEKYEESILEFMGAIEKNRTLIVTDSSLQKICIEYFKSDVKELRRMSSRVFSTLLPLKDVFKVLKSLLSHIKDVEDEILKETYLWTICNLALRLEYFEKDSFQRDLIKIFPYLSNPRNRLLMFSDENFLRYHPGYFSYAGSKEINQESLSLQEFDTICFSDEEKKCMLTQIHKLIQNSNFFLNMYSESNDTLLRVLSVMDSKIVSDLLHDLNSSNIKESNSEKVKNEGLIMQSMLCVKFLNANQNHKVLKYLADICQEVYFYSRGRISESYRWNSAKIACNFAAYILQLDLISQNNLFHSIWDLLSDDKKDFPPIHIAQFIKGVSRLLSIQGIFSISQCEIDLFNFSDVKQYLFESEDGLNVFLDRVDNYLIIRDEISNLENHDTVTLRKLDLKMIQSHSQMIHKCITFIQESPCHYKPFSKLWSNKLYPVIMKLVCVLSVIDDLTPDLQALYNILKGIVISS